MTDAIKKSAQKEEVSKWSRFRHRYPYESEESVGLDFNFWVTNRCLNLEVVTDVLESCIFPTNDINKPTPLKALPAIENTICLFLEDFDPCYYTDFYDNLSFFTKSTSVPIVSAKIETIKRELSASSNPSSTSNYTTTSTANSNAWFWNDVKHLPSLLLRPHFAFNFLTSENKRPLSFNFADLMSNHQIAWQCQHALLNDMMIFTPEKYDIDSMPIILEGAKAAFTLNRLQDHPIFSYLFDSKDYEQLLFGAFYIPRISSNGFYIAKIPSNKETNNKIKNDQDDWKQRIVLTLMWQNGVVDIFYEEERPENENTEGSERSTSGYPVNQFLSFQSKNMQGLVQPLGTSPNMTSKEDDEDSMRLTMISLRPLKYMDPITPTPSTSTNTGNGQANPEDLNSSAPDIVTEDSKDSSANLLTAKEGSLLQNSQKSLEALKSNYEESRLTIEDFKPFILSNDVLEMLGYLLDATYVQCLDSSNPTQWKFRDGNNPFLLKAAQEEAERKALLASKSKFGGLALEEGEEEEEGEEKEEKKEEIAVKTLPPLLQKMKEQALMIFPFDTILNQLPYQQYLFPSSSMETAEPSIFPLDLCAIDCEMCSTKDGLELTRITILHPIHGIIIDTLVKPKLPITDYHTEFSGVTAESLTNITITLQDIQDFLPLVISKDTILIGHSLDNDLKALRIVHHRIIDTAALFPHDQGLPHKIALKKLAKDYLHIDIQDGINGHDSIQDSVTSLELLLLQVKYWKEEISKNHSLSTKPVRNESMLKELLTPLDPLAEATANTLTSLASPSTSTMKFTFFDYLLYRRQFITSKMSENLSIHVSQQLVYADCPSWERISFGYRKEGDLTTLVEQFQSQLNAERMAKEENIRVETSVNHCESWKGVLVSMLKQATRALPSNSEGESSKNHRVVLGSISLKDEIKRELASLQQEALKQQQQQDTKQEEDQQSSKRRKVEDSSFNGFKGEKEERFNFFQLFNETINQFYNNLPERTMFMIFTQKDLKEMRKLIAKKIRYKWENAPAQQQQPPTNNNNNNNNNNSTTTQPSQSNSNDTKKIAQKRPRVIVPLKQGVSLPNNNGIGSGVGVGRGSGGGGAGNKRQFQQSQSQVGAILGYDWDPSNDENKLIEETNRVASSVLYMRYK